jgi:hypothetical protein
MVVKSASKNILLRPQNSISCNSDLGPGGRKQEPFFFIYFSCNQRILDTVETIEVINGYRMFMII